MFLEKKGWCHRRYDVATTTVDEQWGQDTNDLTLQKEDRSAEAAAPG